MCAATARALVECPFEYAKVRGQTGQSWHFLQAYKGFEMLYPRTLGLMTTYFVLIDSIRRHTPAFNYKIGQFLASGGSAMFAFWLVWPLETLKN